MEIQGAIFFGKLLGLHLTLVFACPAQIGHCIRKRVFSIMGSSRDNSPCHLGWHRSIAQAANRARPNSDRPRTFTEKVAHRAASLGEQFGSKYSPKAEVEDEEEEEKEICTVCWACQSGTVVAAGYVDEDIWLWAVPTLKEGGLGDHSEADLPFISGTPLHKIDLVPGKSMKMPMILIKWCASGKGGKDNKDASGQLFVYGGSDLNATQALTVDSSSTCILLSFPQSILCRLVFFLYELMNQ